MGDGAEGRQRIGWHPAKRRLQAEDAGKTRRNADRTAAIGAERQWRVTGSGRRRRPAGGAAGCLADIPRVAGDAGQRRIGNALPAEFRRRGAPQEHRTAFAQTRDAWCILIPGLVGADGFGAAQGGPALDQQQVLDQRRNAIDGALRLTLKPALFAQPRGVKGLRPADFHHGVEGRLMALDLGEAGLHHIDGRKLLFGIALDELRGGFPVEIAHGPGLRENDEP